MVHYICARVVALCYFMHAVRHTYRHHKYRFPFCSARPPLATAPLLLAAVVFPPIEFDIRPPTPLNGGDCSQHPPIEIHGRAVKKEEGVRTSLPWAKQASKKIAWRACGAIVDGAQRRTGPNLGRKAALARKGICKICFKGRTTLLRSLHSDRNNGSTPPTHKKKILEMCATPYQHRLAAWCGKLSTPAEGNIETRIKRNRERQLK